MDFCTSQTRQNLMRAFAGESQARNRYTFAQAQMTAQKQFMLADLFRFTADQENEHAEIFYNHLKANCAGECEIQAAYPVDEDTTDIGEILTAAASHEFKEAGEIYKAFAATAREEGFAQIAQDFENIASIESTHAQRFERMAQLYKSGKLFSSDESTKWICLNCGYILEGTQVPQNCPVCHGDRGYYIRLDMADWGLYR